MMVLAILIFGFGTFISGIFPFYFGLFVRSPLKLQVFGIGTILSGIGIFSFSPNLQAYMGSRVPSSQMGRNTGVLEVF